MLTSSDRTVLFADLRGSTSLYESMGNAHAAEIVTRTVGLLARTVTDHGGRVVKTLGDGLMAVFPEPLPGVHAAYEMQDVIARIMYEADTGSAALRVYSVVAHGEIVEVAGDCFGDAVNVAARLLQHAGDLEVLITEQAYNGLGRIEQMRFHSLDRLHLRGRAEPVKVYVLEAWHGDAAPSTLLAEFADTPMADCLNLKVPGAQRSFTSQQTPVVLGRSPESTFQVDDTRVSRQHARIEWHGGNFHLSDQSSNGCYVRFANEPDVIVLRRGTCMLHGSGVIGLGSSPSDPNSALVQFEVVSCAQVMPRP